MAKYTVTYTPSLQDRDMTPFMWVGYLDVLDGNKADQKLFQLRVTHQRLLRVDNMRVNGKVIPDTARTMDLETPRAEFIVRDDVTDTDFELIRVG